LFPFWGDCTQLPVDPYPDRQRSWRNYASAEMAGWYFMHKGRNRDGAHFLAYIHDLKANDRAYRKN